MYKKGFSAHIDWVIGIGIFLVYLGLVFIIFKPGVTPVFDSETLLDIVENNFIDYNDSNGGAWWNISKTPVFVTPRGYGSPGANCRPQRPITDRQAVIVLKNFNSNLQSATHFGFVAVPNNELFLIPEITDFTAREFQSNEIDLDANRRAGGEGNRRAGGEGNAERIPARTRVDDNAAGASDPVIDLRPFSVGFTSIGSDLKLIAPLKNENKASKFLLLHSVGTNTINSGSVLPATPAGAYDDLDAGFNEGCYFDVEGIDDPCGAGTKKCIAKYSFGTTEYVEGINVNRVPTTITTEDYQELKKKWTFPELKEFQIVIYDTEREYGRFPNYPLPAGVNVYSRQVNTFILNKDGIRIPVTVNFMVW